MKGCACVGDIKVVGVKEWKGLAYSVRVHIRTGVVGIWTAGEGGQEGTPVVLRSVRVVSSTGALLRSLKRYSKGLKYLQEVSPVAATKSAIVTRLCSVCAARADHRQFESISPKYFCGLQH